MNVIVPPKRKDGGSSFLKLVSYLSQREDKPAGDDVVSDTPTKPRSESSKASFDRLVDYIDRSGSTDAVMQVMTQFSDGRQRVLAGDVACETNAFSLETAAAEMNMVAAQNRHVKDPVYHFIISWREEDDPTDAQAFESAQYALKSLGLEAHQYVTAIHRDTDNVHAHVAVNRVHPVTYKAANMWNDVDVLQKSMRVLERRYGFKPDNGTWQLTADNKLVRPGLRYSSAPQGAAKRQIFSNQESLYHYAVATCREEVNKAFSEGKANWKYLHLTMHENGLGLREQGDGLVIYDYLRPEGAAVKASSIHPSLTKASIEPHYGKYVGPPQFVSDDPYQGDYGIFKTYQPSFEVRDKGARTERREERAEAREALKARYHSYRDKWVKPDLNVKGRYQQIAVRYQAIKAEVRRSHSDPLLRKLMYRVAEFERMKAAAELRIELRLERQELADSGQLRPLAYRQWVEQEALRGDLAAVSQLRGFAYREKRMQLLPDSEHDRTILCGRADDAPLLNRPTHTSLLSRDGTIKYLRDGIVGVIDRGGYIQVKRGFEDYDDSANYRLAARLACHKSGERLQVHGDGEFVDCILEAGCELNNRNAAVLFQVTDLYQRQRYAEIEYDLFNPRHASNARVGHSEESALPEPTKPGMGPRW